MMEFHFYCLRALSFSQFLLSSLSLLINTCPLKIALAPPAIVANTTQVKTNKIPEFLSKSQMTFAPNILSAVSSNGASCSKLLKGKYKQGIIALYALCTKKPA